MLRKVNKIVKNIDIQEVINKIEKEEEESFYIELREMNIYYKNKNEYKVNVKNNDRSYKRYHDYNMEENVWTSIRAS